MDRETRRQFEEFRRGAGPIENQVIDDLLDGSCDRSGFLQRGAMFGLSISALGAALAAAGEAPLAFARSNRLQAGGRLKFGINGQPYGAIEPYTFNSISGVDVAAPSAEYLARITGRMVAVPELALSWKANSAASRWTITLRPKVKFHTGQTMSAADVIATYKRLTDPAQGSAALSNFKGVLSPDGIRAGGRNTVIFDLESPNAFFPYLIGSTSYQSMILPASYQPGTFISKPQGTGPFVLKAYNTSVSATYDRFPRWWGGHTPLDGIDSTIYAALPAMWAALLSGSIQLVDDGFDPSVDGKPNLHVYALPGASQGQVAMRVDMPPWNDYRVRQALAYSIDRPTLAKALYGKRGTIGNDTPFSPAYPYTAKVPQRKQNLTLAKQLLAASGHPNGFSATLTTGNEQYKKTIAEVVQASAKKIGIDITLELLDPSVYYGGSPTATPWLNAPFTVTTWANRPTVMNYLTATLITGGAWNAARYSNPKFDALVKSFAAAIALKDQRKYAKQMQLMLLHDTPNLSLAWAPITSVGSTRVHGFPLLPIGISMGKVSLSK